MSIPPSRLAMALNVQVSISDLRRAFERQGIPFTQEVMFRSRHVLKQQLDRAMDTVLEETVNRMKQEIEDASHA